MSSDFDDLEVGLHVEHVGHADHSVGCHGGIAPLLMLMSNGVVQYPKAFFASITIIPSPRFILKKPPFNETLRFLVVGIFHIPSII